PGHTPADRPAPQPPAYQRPAARWLARPAPVPLDSALDGQPADSPPGHEHRYHHGDNHHETNDHVDQLQPGHRPDYTVQRSVGAGSVGKTLVTRTLRTRRPVVERTVTTAPSTLTSSPTLGTLPSSW